MPTTGPLPSSGARAGGGCMVRERFFKPRLRFKSYEEMNAWLLDRCVAYAKAHRHPESRIRRSGRPAG